MKKIILLIIILAVSAMGQEVYFGQNKVHYQNYDWCYIQTHNFDIYMNENQDSIATFAAGALENAYAIIKDELDHELTARVPVIIYSSPNDFQQTNVTSELLPEGVGGFTEIFKNRIVVPFDGSYENFRHVLHHELTHAVTFNLLYENAIGSILSSRAFFRMPLWLAEGYAEYSSHLGWTYEEDMYMRDAVIEGYLPPISQLNGLLNYKAGHALIAYIADTYGEQKIPELFKKGKALFTIEKAVNASIGTKIEKLSKDWQIELRRVYWPELSKRSTYDEIGKALTDHREDGSVFNSNPQWSPKKDRMVITSDRASPRDGYSDRFNDIFVISAIDGQVIDKIVAAEKSGDLESLHSYFSGISWSPDGSKVVFIAKSHGEDALFFLDVESKDIYLKYKPHLGGLRDPDWSPQDDKIVVTGIQNGFSDLYMYDIEADRFVRLTYNKYDETDADFSPDGSKIAFASDRPVDNSIDTSDTSFVYGNYNIFIYDLDSNNIESLTNDDTKSFQPDYSPDGDMLAYVSYRNGIANIYIHDFTKDEDFPITDILTGVFSPSWSPEGDKMAVSVFNGYGYDIVVIKDIKPASEDNELPPTSFRETGRLYPDKEPLLASAEDTAVVRDEQPNIDYSRYIFRAGYEKTQDDADLIASEDTSESDLHAEDIKADSLEYLAADGTFKKNKYSLKFSPEMVAGGFSYDNFYGLRGQSYISISDMLGNHHFYIITDVINSIDQSNIQIAYRFLGNRIDYGAGVFHYKNIYWDDYRWLYFSDRIYGAWGLMSYPFTRFSRLDCSLSQITIYREYLDDASYLPSKTSNLLLGNLSYVSDGVIWGIVGPVYGQRYKVSLEHSVKAVSSGFSFTSLEVDYRKYFHFADEYNFAFRLAGGASFGENARKYYLGGTSYWIDPSVSTNNIYDVEDIYINKMVVPLRGYNYFEYSGEKYVLMNLELRYPFIDYFKMRWPLGMVLTQVKGSLFWDIGAAFDTMDDFYLWDTAKGFPKFGTPKSGVGFAAQANLGIFVLRWDVAWATDLYNIAHKPDYYFSFGANY
ncbi:MAG: PD40 domain-containing protein [candidate division Zixibacteria bacterium]|nr:PD40 domain-containing protein [candidate division Zixibacteria bacterium]